MDGVTQSRTFAPQIGQYYYVQSGHSYRGDYRASGTDYHFYGGDQTTTSFRTKRGMSLADTENGFVQETGSQGGFAAELQAEARESGVRSLLNYGRTSFDNGHEFSTQSTTYEWFTKDHSMVAMGSPYGDLEYHGMILATSSPALPDLPAPRDISLDGQRLFKAAAPNKPEAGMLQFIAETRQDVPRMLGSTVLKEKFNRQSAGGEYLNLQFGLIPTWSDLQKLSQSVLHAGKLLRQYRDNANRQVRRRRSLPTESSITEQVGPSGYPLIGEFFDVYPMQLQFWESNDQLGKTLVTDVTQTNVWFSGAFTYYMNEGHSILDRLDRYEEQANHLLGTRFSADTFWELSPFSWLADWYSDTGTFISNIVALDSDELVMKYGYVMHETRATRTYLKTGLKPREGSGAPTSLRLDVNYVKKQRHRASPYGFGLIDADLTLRQQAILAALGMTQGSGSRVL